jgi:uncharacterized coiled-coil protein SlyX
MKKRNIIAVLSALVGFALCQQVQAAPAPETPDPGAVGGSLNTADGSNALGSVTTGTANSAFGWFSLVSDTDASFNTAVGAGTLLFNNAGSNTAVGAAALLFNTGSANTAVGVSAGIDNDTGSNNIYIGDTGVSGESNVIAIGGLPSSGTAYTDCFIGGIFGNTNPGVAVFIGADGHLSTTASSARFKDDIKPMANASESIFALRPVTFRYKKEYDANGTQQFGLVAEEVAKVNPDLVFLGRDGKPYTVRYEQVNAMLLNEFLREHKKVEAQQVTIAELKSAVAQQHKRMEVLTAQLKEQAAQIQKVSAQLEVSKPAPQTVANK